MRHRYIDVRARARDWHSLAVNGGREPDRAVSWVEENIRGDWTWRPMTDSDVWTRLGLAVDGKFFLEFLFADQSDCDKCLLRFGRIEGKS